MNLHIVLEPGTRFADRYRIERLLGCGTRKCTYLAEDTKVGDRLVALSIVHPEAMVRDPESARREANLLSRVKPHSHIVACYLYDIDGPDHYLVFEYLSGGSLADFIKRTSRVGSRVPCDLIVRYGRELTKALMQIHGAGVLHRDVTPASIFLDHRQKVKLGDFDSAILLDERAIAGDALPVPDESYASPEECRGDFLDQRSDLYSLGCVLVSLALAALHIHDPAVVRDRRPDLPPDVHDLLDSLVAARPDDRPPGAEAVLKSLNEIWDSLGSSALPLASGGRPEHDPKDLGAPSGRPRKYTPGDVIDGRFEVISPLDEGGFSQVYRVRDTVEGEERALKLFKPTGRPDEAVSRELKALRKIRHPRVVEVFWADKTDAGDWYLITEFVEGEVLESYVRGEARLSDRDAVDAILDVLEALTAIHPDAEAISKLKKKEEAGALSEAEYLELQQLKAEGLVHRDVKPSNVILTSTGARLLDFNIASRVGESIRTSSGTPPYQAPDANQTEWDVSTDLFATGVMLYELLCDGHHPYPRAQPMVDTEVINPRSFRPALDASLASFLMRACDPESLKRFRTASSMRHELRSIRLNL